jgi:Flp pilus assembly protein TadG
VRWLTSRLIRAGRDRGAAVLFVAILTPAVLLGIGAFVVDVGAYYSERAQTQNGADAGAVAIANTCALSTCDPTAADAYAPANSNGNLGTNSVVSHAQGFPCGKDPKAALPACPSGTENGSICPRPASSNYVDVQVNTDPGVPAFFAAAFGAGPKKIGSCAQAIWGTPVIGGDVLALTVAECVWNTDTAGGTNYAPAPPAVPSAGYEVALVVHNPDDPTDPTCTSGPSVGPLPGGFGWTQTDNLQNTPCTTAFIPNSGGWYQSDPGQGSQTGAQCLDKGNGPGVIPCAQNPAVPNPPNPPNQPNGCPTPPTPSPLIVPVYDRVCAQNGSTSVSVDEKQSVTVSSNATGGTYTLTFTDGSGNVATTAAIAYNANAAAVTAALAALPNVNGSSNVVVTGANGAANGPSPFTVEFTGALAHTDFALMTADFSKLTPGGKKGAAVTVGGVQDGAFVATACPAGFANGKYYHLLTLAAFVVTGYEGSAFPHDKASWLTGRNWCVNQHGSDPACLLGYFVKATTEGTVGSGPDTGVTVVELNG